MKAQAWILRLQEMGALQSSSLQAELRESTDQFHQYYLGFQCQVMDMERNHLQAMQRLQSELAVAREQNGLQSTGSQAISGSSMDCLLYDKSQGNESNANDSVTSNGTLKFMSNGQLNGAASFVSSSYISAEVKHAPDMPVVQPSIVGVGRIPSHTHHNHYLPSNQAHYETKPPIVHKKQPAFNLSQQLSAASMPVSSTQNNLVISTSIVKCNGILITSEDSVPTSLTSNPSTAAKAIEPVLLDERSILSCIVRAIPAGSGNGIRISSTLPNRLGKMLAPLNWHDYKKKYGKLDDLVAHHPELFMIEGDFIRLREGRSSRDDISNHGCCKSRGSSCCFLCSLFIIIALPYCDSCCTD